MESFAEENAAFLGTLFMRMQVTLGDRKVCRISPENKDLMNIVDRRDRICNVLPYNIYFHSCPFT
jgi:hypothetical protein